MRIQARLLIQDTLDYIFTHTHTHTHTGIPGLPIYPNSWLTVLYCSRTDYPDVPHENKQRMNAILNYLNSPCSIKCNVCTVLDMLNMTKCSNSETYPSIWTVTWFVRKRVKELYVQPYRTNKTTLHIQSQNVQTSAELDPWPRSLGPSTLGRSSIELSPKPKHRMDKLFYKSQAQYMYKVVDMQH